jgi:selenocysteine-specific elongation factor
MVLGTAGHIDHGKTSLVRALTGIETDRHPEEKRRGITIELGFASWPLASDLEASIVDVPGHDSLVRTMIAGAGGIDLVLMVISAEDGVMPQTREHLNVCSLLGVRAGVVALSKVDRIEDPDEVELAVEDVRECLEGTVFENAPIIPCSAHDGTGLDELRREILERLRKLPGRDRKGPVRYPIDRAFSMKGHGTVVTGTLLSGQIDLDKDSELLHLSPKPRVEPETRRLRGLQVRGESVNRARAGSRVAINLGGVEKEAFSRGDVLISPGGALRTEVFHGRVSLLDWSRVKMQTGRGLQVCAGTAFANAKVDLLAIENPDTGAFEPNDSGRMGRGATGLVRFRLETPLVVWWGQRFVLRAFDDPDALTHGLTVGGGSVVDPLPSSGRAQRPRWVRVGNELVADDPTRRALASISDAGIACIDRPTLEARAGINKAESALGQALKNGAVVAVTEGLWVDAEQLDALRAEGLAIADRYHAEHPLAPGIGQAELEAKFPGRCHPSLTRWLIEDALTSGALRRADDQGRLARPGKGQLDPEALPSELQAVRDLYEHAELTPPTLKDLQATLGGDIKSIVERVTSLQRAKLLVRISDDLSYSAAAHQRLLETVAKQLRSEGQLDVQVLKALTGLSRKFAVPLMEHFDRLGLTIRKGT